MNRIKKSLLLFLTLLGSFASVAQEERGGVNEQDDRSGITVQNWRSQQIDERRNNRGLVDMNNVFVDKGQWITGLNASYSTHKNDNYDFLIIDGITSHGYNFEVSPFASYAFAPNVAAGARFLYNRQLLSIEKANISFGDEESGVHLNANEYYALQHNYSMMAVVRQYILFGNNKRFALFNEMQLEVGGMQSKFAFDSPVKGTFATGKNISLGLAPGVTAFATDHVAFEVSVGVMGISYSRVKQVHNQVEVGNIKSSMMNLKINLLSIGVGVAFYL